MCEIFHITASSGLWHAREGCAISDFNVPLETAISKLLYTGAIALLAFGFAPGKAEAAAFCTYAGGVAAYENCGYHTWEQCLAAIRSRGGYCMRNPHDPALWGSARDGKGRRGAAPEPWRR